MHGCRTLLKKGNKEVLDIFGFGDAQHVHVKGFALSATSVSIGNDLSFSFIISAYETTKVRLEYGIDYVKTNGSEVERCFRFPNFR